MQLTAAAGAAPAGHAARRPAGAADAVVVDAGVRLVNASSDLTVKEEDMVQEISCSICGEGTLKKKKKHRLSGPAVFIGYVLLIPGIIGLLIGIVLLFTTGKATVDVTENMQTEIETTLKEKGIPENIIQKVLSTETISESELAVLSEDQKSAVETAEWTLTGGTVGAGIGAAVAGSISIGIIVSSLIGCLLGFILTMKKKVLQCKNCGAIIQAS